MGGPAWRPNTKVTLDSMLDEKDIIIGYILFLDIFATSFRDNRETMKLIASSTTLVAMFQELSKPS